MSATDQRSVGELLLEAEQRARDLLHEAPDRDGLSMVRTWGEVVETAADTWRHLPDTTARQPVQAVTRLPDVMDQLERASKAMHAGHRGGTGYDPTLLSIAETYSRASDLVAKYPTTGPLNAEQRDDITAARTRILHSLYLSSHAITVALRNNLNVDQQPPHRRGTITVMRDAHRRICAAERLIDAHLRPLHPEALNGQHQDPIHPNRLGEAISTWDVESHRALAQRPTARTLALIAGQHMLSAHIDNRLWQAAADTGHVHASQLRTRLSPALEQLGEKWGQNHRLWDGLTPNTDPTEPMTLRAAAGELMAAYRQLTHDRVGPATPDVIASRTDMTVLIGSLQQSLATSAEIAHAFRDATTHEGLRIDPKVAMTLIKQREERGLIPASPASAVPTTALANNRPIAIPEPLTKLLSAASQQPTIAANISLGASAGIERMSHAPDSSRSAHSQSRSRLAHLTLLSPGHSPPHSPGATR